MSSFPRYFFTGKGAWAKTETHLKEAFQLSITLQVLIFVATMAPIRLLFHALYLDGQVAFMTSIFPDDDLDDDMDEPATTPSRSRTKLRWTHMNNRYLLFWIDDYG